MGGLVGAMLCLAGQPCFQVTIAPTPSSFPSPSWVAGKMLLEYPGNANLARYLIVSRAAITQSPKRGISVVNKHRMILWQFFYLELLHFHSWQAMYDYNTPQIRKFSLIPCLIEHFVFLYQFCSRTVLVLVGLPHLSLALPASQDPCFQVAKPPHFDSTLSTLSTQDFDNFEDCWGTKQEEFCKDEVRTLSAPL